MEIIKVLASEFKKEVWQIENSVALMDEGCTIPFIARYRKEMHGAMDDTTLRNLETRLTYLRNLQNRRDEVKKSIENQGKLTEELKLSVNSAVTLAEVEDLYRPYKQKKRTRAIIAKEKGFEKVLDRTKSEEYEIGAKDLSTLDRVIEIAKEDFTGLCFVNLVDFDALWGHRRDVVGYAGEIEKFDEKLGELLPLLREDDLLILTADHGNDPTYTGTDHTREKVPFVAWSPSMQEGGLLPEQDTFAVIGATIAKNFNVDIMGNIELLLGDFAIQVGWLCPDVILYMAFVSIANFTQSSYELGYAFKYMRMLILILTALFDIYGFIS